MAVAYNPQVVTNGLVLSLDAGNQKSLNIPSLADHGYAEWYCLLGGTAVYSIINTTGGIIYENNAGTITALVTATGPQRGTITVTAGRKYYGSVPINLVVEDAHQCLAPLTMVGTQFWNVAARAGVTPSTYYVYSPYQAATVNFYDGVATGLAGTPTSTLSLSAGQSGTFSSSTNNNHWISSNVPILATATQNGADKTILSPMSTYVYQRYQAYYNTTNNTTPTTLNTYVTYDSTYKVMNMTIADGSGGDCAQGLGLEYLSDTYSWGNVVSDYAIIFPYTATVVTSYWNGSSWVVWDTHSNIAGSITNPPRVFRDGTNGPGVEGSILSGGAANMASGATLWKWEGTAPFYIVINDGVDDEFAMLGWLSARSTTPRSSITWTNLSNSTNNGSLINGPVFSLDNGGYLSFDGSNDYIVIPNNTALDTQTPSVEVWVKTNATTQSGFWFEKGEVNFQYSLFQEAGYLVWRMNIGGSVTNLVVNPTSSYMNTTSWYQVVGTYISGSRRLYINGVLVGSDTQTGTISTNNGGMSIGAYGGFAGAFGRGYFYNGNLSICRVYNRALTPSEVQQNFNATRGRYGI